MQPNLRQAAPDQSQQPCQPELPLTKKPEVLPLIALSQVWGILDQQQRERFFQRLAVICSRLTMQAKPEEKKHE